MKDRLRKYGIYQIYQRQLAFLNLMDNQFGKDWIKRWVEKDWKKIGIEDWIPACGDCGGERKKIEQADWSAETLRRYQMFVGMGKKVEQVVYCERCKLESILFEAEDF